MSIKILGKHMNFFKGKLFLVYISLFSANFMHAQTIPNSSYYIVEGFEKRFLPFDRPEKRPSYATFYSFQGDEVAKISLKEMNLCDSHVDYNVDHRMLRKMLDPRAPKPQPVKYIIQWWPAIRVKSKLLGFIPFSVLKGCPGNFIAFIDKNGNCIYSCRYNEQMQKVRLAVQECAIANLNYLI